MKCKLKYLAIISILMIGGILGYSNQNRCIYSEDKLVFNEDYSNKSEEDIVEVGNYYLVKNNWLLGKFSKIIPNDKMKLYSDSINKLSQFSKSQNKDIYFVSMTHKTNMLKHLYPEVVKNKNNIDLNKDNLKSNLNKDYISFIDIDEYFLSDFTDSEREKFYFKTDHHWNGLGAFEGFKFIIKDMNLNISKDDINNYFDQYNIKINKEKEFLGSYNRKLNFIVKEKEFANYVYKDGSKLKYFINDGKIDKKISEKDIIATQRDKQSWDYGGTYMRGTNCNILKIKNDKPLVNKKVLIFRDSYQAPMTGLLADAFSEVQIVDPRYIENIDMTYEEIIKDSDSDIVMFMYNSFGFEGMIQEMINKGI